MGKETKTNAMRILDRMKIPYTLNQYQCDEFIDGVHVADLLGQSYDESFKTIVTIGKSRSYYVFALPIDKEIDLKKAAKVVGEKNLELLFHSDRCTTASDITGHFIDILDRKQFQILFSYYFSCLFQVNLLIDWNEKAVQNSYTRKRKTASADDRIRWKTGRTDFVETG